MSKDNEAAISFEEWEAKQMLNPAFRAEVERQEPAYQAARLRMLQGDKIKDVDDWVCNECGETFVDDGSECPYCPYCGSEDYEEVEES